MQCSLLLSVFNLSKMHFRYVNKLPSQGRKKPQGPQNNSDLWNAMIYPFLNMTIYGAIWYQGNQHFIITQLCPCHPLRPFMMLVTHALPIIHLLLSMPGEELCSNCQSVRKSSMLLLISTSVKMTAVNFFQLTANYLASNFFLKT